MERDDYLTHLRRDGHRMADLAEGDLSAPVPTCPDWTLAELVRHTGNVHRWQTAAVRDDPAEFPDPATWRLPPAEGQPLADWFRAGVDEAVAVLSAATPGERRWTWAGPGTTDFYFRRIAQETLVHRIDAELAAGVEPEPVDPGFAVDGIDEMCDVFIPHAEGQPVGGSGETLHLHATDATGEWLFTMHGDHVEVARGHAKGDAAVRATARDLLLISWGRDPLGELEVFGDESVVARFRTAAAL
ncbi:MAG TPA: maleylpyruvate isomerase family mycothiol-dependent enzyme [Acidimicrobiales bacterium]|nr:maleylpyruvate isomerase family mycothiol-dependent enzyme [Acidimicrobiales bacterium]